MPSYTDPKYHCGCCHVEECAWYYAFTGAGLSLVLAILVLIWHLWSFGALELISAFLYLCIIFAQYKRKPTFYLPFLIGNALILVVYFVYAIIFLIIFFSPGLIKRTHDEWVKKDPGKEYSESDIREIFGGLSLQAFILVAICSAFWYVVYRAYRYMEDTG